MFESRLRLSRQKTMPKDCIICASSPSLYLNQLNICYAKFYCYHSIPPSRPHFKTSKALKTLTLFVNVVLVIGIFNDVNQIEGEIKTPGLVLLSESVFSISTVIFNILFLLKCHIKIKESHGLITVINHKLSFGVDNLLTSESAKKIYDILLILIMLLFFEEVITLCRTIIVEEFKWALLVRICTIEIMIFSHASIGLYVLQFLNLYKSLFRKCFDEIEKCLDDIVVRSGTSSKERIQKLQRLYMCLRRNFKLNETFIQPGAIIIYTVDICLLLIGYSYLTVMYINGEIVLMKFDLYIVIKSLAIVVVFCIFCYEAQEVLTMCQNTISFLFKCPISKLTQAESAQVEMLIAALSIQRTDIKASNIFTVGTALLATISGTVLTYVLVALQFHAMSRK